MPCLKKRGEVFKGDRKDEKNEKRFEQKGWRAPRRAGPFWQNAKNLKKVGKLAVEIEGKHNQKAPEDIANWKWETTCL